MIDPIWLGIIAVVGASVFIVLRPKRFFGRKLSLEEALSVCWVAWSIYMAAYVVHIGLKLPLGLRRAANAPAAGIAVCISVVAILWLARRITDWRGAVANSIFGLFTLALVVVGAVWLFH